MNKLGAKDIFEFANTSLGKFFTVAIAVCVALSLSGVALAVDGAVQTFTIGPKKAPAANVVTTEASDPSGESVETGQAYVKLKLKNCSVSYEGAIFEQGFKVPQNQDLTFKVIPLGSGEEYVVERVSVQIGTNEPWELVPVNEEGVADYSSAGTYTVPSADLEASPSITVEANAIEPYEAPVVSLKDMTRTYIGFQQPAYGYDLEIEATGLQSYELDGETYTDEFIVQEFTGAATNAGTYKDQLAVTKYWIKRPTAQNEDVTRLYKSVDLSKAKATLTINKADLYIVTPSAVKFYDGTPLTYEGEDIYTSTLPELINTPNFYTYSGASMLYELYDHNLPEYELVVSGSQTEIGTSNNRAEIRPASVQSQLAKNYNIQTHFGRLTVLPPNASVAVIAPSNNKFYDGRALTVSEKDIQVEGLPTGFTASAKLSATSRTNAGTTKVNIDKKSLVIRNAQGKDVTSLYEDVALIPGELEVLPAKLTVTTKSAKKKYDGTPITAGGKVSGIMNKETLTLVTTGSQTDPGSSKNTYKIKWDGTAKKKNYEISHEKLGKLTITGTPVNIVNVTEDDTPTIIDDNVVTGNEDTVAQTTGGGVAVTGGNAGTGGTSANGGGSNSSAAGFTPSATPSSSSSSAASSEEKAEATSTGGSKRNQEFRAAIESLATGMQNAEQVLRGEEPTPLAAPITEETLADDETPLGVFDAPVDCWVHWYSILGLIATAIYGGVVMFFRRAYAYELESREANILGVPVGLAQPQTPAGSSSHAGREA